MNTLFDTHVTPYGTTYPVTSPAADAQHDGPETLEDRFAAWIGANPAVLEEFIRRALAAKAAGYKRIAAKRITEEMRGDWPGKTTGDTFKINNSYVTLLARLAVACEPSLDGLFEFRNLE